jgi:AbiV family abortive infection protein
MAVATSSRPLPPADDLVALIQAAVHNARDLLDDASLLLDAGRPPRAHALATLSLEEIGKGCLCLMALFPQPEPFYGSRSKGDFWKAWQDHSDKLGWALGFLELLIREPTGPVADAVARLMRAAHDGHLRKLRGFYIDYRDGKVLTPGQVSAIEAQQVVEDVRALLEVAVDSWLSEGFGDRVRELEQHDVSVADMQAQMAQAVTADPDSFMSSFRQFFQDQLAANDEPAD